MAIFFMDRLYQKTGEAGVPYDKMIQLRRKRRVTAMANKKFFAIGCLGVILLGVLAIVLFATGIYNSLVGLDQKVQAQWGQVENVYQRRADLVPNLVETVKGAAAFEKDTFTAVTEARSKVGQVQVAAGDLSSGALAKFQEAQDGLSSALSRLLVVMEKYPDLKATENFKELQAQLEGTENRITVERMRFNEAAQAFNTRRMRFPAVFFAGFFGERFKEKPYFKAQAGAETAPKVKF
jgi:LemA protein